MAPYPLGALALPQALEGLSYGVRYQPVFLGGLLKAKQQLGPAEIPMKREWVYRQSQWLAQAQGVRLDLELPQFTGHFDLLEPGHRLQ